MVHSNGANTSTTRLNARLADDIRKSSLHHSNNPMLIDLVSDLKRIFSLPSDANLLLKYKDQDGDLVSLTSDNDLPSALKTVGATLEITHVGKDLTASSSLDNLADHSSTAHLSAPPPTHENIVLQKSYEAAPPSPVPSEKPETPATIQQSIQDDDKRLAPRTRSFIELPLDIIRKITKDFSLSDRLIVRQVSGALQHFIDTTLPEISKINIQFRRFSWEVKFDDEEMSFESCVSSDPQWKIHQKSQLLSILRNPKLKLKVLSLRWSNEQNAAKFNKMLQMVRRKIHVERLEITTTTTTDLNALMVLEHLNLNFLQKFDFINYFETITFALAPKIQRFNFRIPRTKSQDLAIIIKTLMKSNVLDEFNFVSKEDRGFPVSSVTKLLAKAKCFKTRGGPANIRYHGKKDRLYRIDIAQRIIAIEKIDKATLPFCWMCNRSYKTRATLEAHMKGSHSRKESPCLESNCHHISYTENERKKHQKIHGKKKCSHKREALVVVPHTVFKYPVKLDAKKVAIRSQKKLLFSSSDSESDTPAKESTPAKKPVQTPAQKKAASSWDSDFDDVRKPAAKPTPKATPVAAKKKAQFSSEDPSDDQENSAAKPRPIATPVAAKKKAESSSDDSSDEKKPAAKPTPKANPVAAKKKAESSFDDLSHDVRKAAATPENTAVAARKKAQSSSEDSSDDDEPAAKTTPKTAPVAAKKKTESSSDDALDDEKKPVPKPTPEAAPFESKKEAETSSEDSSDKEKKPAAKPTPKATPVAFNKKAQSSSEDSSDDVKKPAATPENTAVAAKKKTESSSDDLFDDETKPVAKATPKATPSWMNKFYASAVLYNEVSHRNPELVSQMFDEVTIRVWDLFFKENKATKLKDFVNDNVFKKRKRTASTSESEPPSKKAAAKESSSSDSSIDEAVEKTGTHKSMKPTSKTTPVAAKKKVDSSSDDSSDEKKKPTTNQWGHRANESLPKVEGKGFRHEKAKKKKGSYGCGPIDQSVRSRKFSDSE